MRTRGRWLVALLLALLAVAESPGLAQTLAAGTARNANGVLVVVRTDGVETRLRGRGALPIFEGDVLRVDGQAALIETEEGVQVVLNGNAVVKILSRWEKGKGVTRILRVQRGEVWARSNDGAARHRDRDPGGRAGGPGGGGERPARVGATKRSPPSSRVRPTSGLRSPPVCSAPGP